MNETRTLKHTEEFVKNSMKSIDPKILESIDRLYATIGEEPVNETYIYEVRSDASCQEEKTFIVI